MASHRSVLLNIVLWDGRRSRRGTAPAANPQEIWRKSLAAQYGRIAAREAGFCRPADCTTDG
jgi:hypothetical protein